jgi:hypothetical protein
MLRYDALSVNGVHLPVSRGYAQRAVLDRNRLANGKPRGTRTTCLDETE